MRNSDMSAKATACSKCGKCRQVCPTFLEELKETQVARGRIHLSLRAEEGKLPPAPSLKHALTTCLLCLRCAEHCPNKIDIENIIIPAREHFLDKKKAPLLEAFIFKYIVSRRRPFHFSLKMMGINDKIISLFHLNKIYRSLLKGRFNIDQKRKLPAFHFRTIFDLYPELISEPGNTKKAVFFPGCSASYSLINVAEAVIRSLLRNGTDVILPRFGCCGMPAYSSGFYDLALKSAQDNVNLLKATGAEIVITGCGSCGKMLRDTYKEMLGSDNHQLRVLDISEYLLETKAQPGSVPLNLHTTYHDPCHLKRSMKIYEEPRTLIKSLPGVEFTEMTDADVCCGSGGTLSLKHYELTRKVRDNKVNMFLRTKAGVLATGCPACILNMQDGFANRKVNADILHPIELWDRSFDKKENLH